MGQTMAKLVGGDNGSNSLESRGMLHDISVIDDSDLNLTTDSVDTGNVTPKTPPNVLKLKFDPRSPSNFNRTPLAET